MKHSFYRMILLISAGLLFCAFAATAQVPITVQWDKTLGSSGDDILSSATATPDGGYLLNGTSLIKIDANGNKQWEEGGATLTKSPDGSYFLFRTISDDDLEDYWIAKLDASGNKQWDKTFGGNAADELADVIATDDGGYLLAGHSTSNASGDKSEDRVGESDYWIVKIDATGNKEWDKTYSHHDEFAQLSQAIPTADGGYLLAGRANNPYYGSYWVVKIDQDGNEQWDYALGGGQYPYLQDIIITHDGGYLLAGNDDNGLDMDYLIAKIDENGNKQWSKSFGSSGDDILSSATATPDGGYLLNGTSLIKIDANGNKQWEEGGATLTKSPDGSYFLFRTISDDDLEDYWIAKLDASGNKQWEIIIDTGSMYTELTRRFATADGGYLLAGREYNQYETHFFVTKIDEAGNEQWAWGYGVGASDGYSDYLSDVVETPDGGYLFVGYVDINGHFEYWATKTDEHGNKQWSKILGGNGDDYLISAVNTIEGGYLLAGHSNSNASGDKSEDSKGGNDYWLVKVVEAEEDFSVKSLSLINADTDKTIAPLQDGDMINLSELGNPHLTVRANTDPIKVDSVKLALTGPITHTQTENHWPYALFGDDPKAGGGRDYIGKMWKAGEYKLTATPYLAGKAGNAHRLSFSVIDEASAAVAYFVLVNADTDKDIGRLREGEVIDLSALAHPTLSIRATPDPVKVDRIELALSGPLSHSQTESFWPYALFGDDPNGPRDYIGRVWEAGNYTLTATPYVNNQKGATATISFSVTGSSSNARLAVEVYPVPTTDIVNITHEGTAEQTLLMLLDFAGHVVLEQPLSRQTTQQLDLSSFRKGFYYLKVVNKEAVEVKRIVVE